MRSSSPHELGFVEGYVGEHVTDRSENITSSAMFIATLIDITKKIRLGTGTINMPNTHPAQTAANLAMLDHLLDGRLIFGISPGGLLSDAEIFGNLDANRSEMFLEAINHVLAIWQGEPPYDLDGKYWKISTRERSCTRSARATCRSRCSGRIRRSWSRLSPRTRKVSPRPRRAAGNRYPQTS